MDNVQIEIQDDDNNILGVLEVGDVKNFPISLTTSIADLRDITTRSGSFSTSFKIPSTKANDDLLQHIYLSDQKNYKDFDAAKDCIIRINGMDIEQGQLIITKINSVGRAKNVEYSFKFFGNNMDWVKKMKDYKTKDLPYLDKTLVYNDASVQATWGNTGGTEDPVYIVINRGYRISPNTVNVGDLRPDYFALDYIESAFSLVGYSFNSTFFNTVENKNLVIPFFGKGMTILQSEIDNAYADIDLTGNTTNVNLNVPNLANQQLSRIETLLTDTCSSVAISPPNTFYTSSGSSTTGSFTEVSDVGNNFASGGYTAPQDGWYIFSGIFETSYFVDETQQEAINGQLAFGVSHRVNVNGIATAIFQTNSTSSVSVAPSTPTEIREVYDRTTSKFYMNAGDVAKIVSRFDMFNYGPVFESSKIAHFKHWGTTGFNVSLQPKIVEGDLFNWADVSDDQYDVFDVVMDIFKLFNCYIRTNQATKTVYVEPRDSFYKDISTATNETDRIDDNTPFTLEYNSKSYNKAHSFAYTTDSNDKFLNDRNNESKTDWCSYEHAFPDKFKDGKKTYKTKIIPATYHALDGDFNAGILPINTSFGIYTAKLWDEVDTIPLASDNFAPRLLYFNYGTQFHASNFNQLYLSYRGDAVPNMPYAMAFNIELGGAPVDGNLSFPDTDFQGISAVLKKGLWQNHFSITSQEIQDGKRLTLNMLFDLEDWITFDFRDVIYFDNRYPEIEGYWRTEKINGYKPTSSSISVSVELTQVREYLPTESVESELPSQERLAGGGERLLGGGKDSTLVSTSTTPSHSFGYDNYLRDDGNLVFGNNLRATGGGQLMYGMYNTDISTDISTDLLQFGVGTPASPRTLIRVDENGNVFFNGAQLPLEGGGGLVVDISTDSTATLTAETYIVDTAGNDVEVYLPTTGTSIGKTWNTKKVADANVMTIVAEGGVNIDDETTITVDQKNTNITFQFDGTNFKIL